MQNSDLILEKIRKLYEKADLKTFDSDLEKGIIAKIDLDNTNYPFSSKAKLSTSAININGKRYAYFIFKNGYYYKNGNLYNGKEIIPTIQKENEKI